MVDQTLDTGLQKGTFSLQNSFHRSSFTPPATLLLYFPWGALYYPVGLATFPPGLYAETVGRPPDTLFLWAAPSPSILIPPNLPAMPPFLSSFCRRTTVALASFLERECSH